MPFVAGPGLPGALTQCCSDQEQPLFPKPLRFRLSGRTCRPIPFASLTATASQGAAAAQNGLQLLPVTTCRGGKRRQYAWDGSRIKAVNMDLLGDGYTPAARLLDHLSQLKQLVKASFLPHPEDVTDDYWMWLKWRLAQRFCSAVVLNFATQSLLTAVGVGAQRALAASAAINWMLKDGISRVVRMSVATQYGDAFDSDLKRFRFGSSLVYSAFLTCEFVAPFFPGSFLLLASVSNVGRAVGLTTFVSTQPAFQQALCASGKMADLASKTQAQHMVMDTMALAVCSGANYLLRHQEARRRLLPLLAFPIFSLGDITCIYHEVKAVQLRTLNRERAEMVAQGWVERGQVPSFAEVSAKERLLLPPCICGNLLPLRFLPLEEVARNPEELQRLMKRHKGDAYMLALQAPQQLPPPLALADRLWSRYRTVPHVAVSLSEGFSPEDACQALLHAAHLRCCVVDAYQRCQRSSSSSSRSDDSSPSGTLSSGGSSSSGTSSSCSSSSSRASSGSGCISVVQQEAPAAAAAVGLLSEEELERCVQESARLARRDARRFVGDVAGAGWKTRNLLLSPQEKAGYSLDSLD